ncbi:translation factor GTPase family protein [Streptomyces sp. RKAG293]|uniref:GTP-binding protein n=1 Tax=Streptomyces sp. RKAG293 TaxID=2893403 RepID=UPI002033AF56|nr:TetM/TetW/TetO/TetS family tetracycline resistance ribosomal protection protein [Streptomyces sp. RKAG293]MCM2416932.1 TetM/TetW/TetO/TetS family tetracycline resistance ribosomal protection protein [Streptomyces sp. RKAG293]
MTTTPLNLGILAHVDAGKTSLTERLLFEHGALAALGSVDKGSTTTDAGELERERGITIRTAVAPLIMAGRHVNLVDTPGHPDFIAEVERALSVLDAAVLVVSAVEGIQAQTRVLMKSLRRLRLPTLIFVNKIDRRGARDAALLAELRRALAPRLIPLVSTVGAGTPAARTLPVPLTGERGEPGAADVLAEHDTDLLARLVDGPPPAEDEIREQLRRQTAAALVQPVFFGSALSGAGIAELAEGIATLLPAPPADELAPARGTVFAVDRAEGGEKRAYIRLFSGLLRERQRLALHRDEAEGTTTVAGRISRLDVVTAQSGHGAPSRGVLTPGGIAVLRGLPGVRVGDRVGAARAGRPAARLAPPGLEAVVRASRPGQQGALHAALSALADEDPFIRTRTASDGTLSLLLHGAVQREVLADRLQREFGIAAEFAAVTPVYRERPVGTGVAVQELGSGPSEFFATVGLRVEPAPYGSGVRYARETEWGALPRAFHRAIEETVRLGLRQGLLGWEVTDCTVTVIRTGWASPMSTAADFRKLTPLVLMRALSSAGTRVHEPCREVEAEIPEDTLGPVAARIAELGGTIGATEESGDRWTLGAELPTARMQELGDALPGLTRGEGSLWSRPGTDRPVRGVPPRRPRTDGNPLDPEEYLRFLADPSLAR